MRTAYTLIGFMIASAALAQAPTNPGTGPRQAGATAEEAFKNRDANKDGFLSRTETSGTRIADAFDKLDTNKDGKLSIDEYKTGRDAMRSQRPGAGPRGKDMEDRRQRMQGPNVEARFKASDTNNDGFLSKAEVNARMAERFDALDTNKDGKLSLDEMKAGRQGMAGMHGGANKNAK